jgi:hypothetical protein
MIIPNIIENAINIFIGISIFATIRLATTIPNANN